MIQANGSPALFFVSPKFGGSHSYKPFDVPWIDYLNYWRLAKVTSDSVCETKKITEFPALLLVKPCLPPANTLNQISNE